MSYCKSQSTKPKDVSVRFKANEECFLIIACLELAKSKAKEVYKWTEKP